MKKFLVTDSSISKGFSRYPVRDVTQYEVGDVLGLKNLFREIINPVIQQHDTKIAIDAHGVVRNGCFGLSFPKKNRPPEEDDFITMEDLIDVIPQIEGRNLIIDVHSCFAGKITSDNWWPWSETRYHEILRNRSDCCSLLLNAGNKPIPQQFVDQNIKSTIIQDDPIESIITKTLFPQTANYFINFGNGKIIHHKIKSPKPESYEDLSDDEIRSHLIRSLDDLSEKLSEHPSKQALIDQKKKEVAELQNDFFSFYRYYALLDLCQDQTEYGYYKQLKKKEKIGNYVRAVAEYNKSGLDLNGRSCGYNRYFSNFNDDDRYFLDVAVTCGNSSAVEALLDGGVEIDRADLEGSTPLLVSVFRGYSEIAKLLCSRGADVNKCNEKGINPVFIATYNGNYDLVKFLLENQARADEANKDGITPLMKAVEMQNVKLSKLLIDYGANKEFLNQLHESRMVHELKNYQPSLVRESENPSTHISFPKKGNNEKNREGFGCNII